MTLAANLLAFVVIGVIHISLSCIYVPIMWVMKGLEQAGDFLIGDDNEY